MIIRVFHSCSLLLLFSSLFVCSCITIDKTLGGNLIPADQDLTLCSATFDLPIDSRPTDSLQTNNHFYIYDASQKLLFGVCHDPLFGTTEAGAVFQFLPRNFYGAGHSYGDNPQPVSLTLTLVCGNNIVLDKSQVSIPQNIFLHEITTDISYKNAYNNSLLPQDWNPAPISQPGQLYFGNDSLRISLSLDFARELLSITQEEKDSAALFIKRFKGFYLKTELPDAGINSGRINFAQTDYSFMTLVYRLDGSSRDSTVSYTLNPYPYGYAFNSITHSNASLDPHPSENIYYQGFAGVKPYIDFEALTRKIRTWAGQSQIDINKLLISRAEIILSYDPGIDYSVINQYPPRLYPYTRKLTDTTAFYLPIDNIYMPNADGTINRSKFHYSMNITSYLHSLLKKEEVTELDNTWLMETKTYEDQQYGITVHHFSSDTYPLALFKGTATDAKPIIKITYTVLK